MDPLFLNILLQQFLSLPLKHFLLLSVFSLRLTEAKHVL